MRCYQAQRSHRPLPPGALAAAAAVMSGSAGTVLVFYLNLFLLVGVLLRHFLKPLARFVPYTVLLLVLGVLLGVAAVPLEEELYGASNRTSSAGGHRRALAASSSSSGGGGSSSNHSAGAHGDVWWSPREDYVTAVRTVATLDPHTLLYVFLPALLFESAQAIDFHVFKKTIIKTTTRERTAPPPHRHHTAAPIRRAVASCTPWRAALSPTTGRGQHHRSAATPAPTRPPPRRRAVRCPSAAALRLCAAAAGAPSRRCGAER